MAASNGPDTPVNNGELAVKPPADVTIPPKGVQDNMTKVCQFLSRRIEDAEEMEQAMIARSGHTVTFSFLNPDDPYHAFYRWYQQQMAEGKVGAVAGGKAAQATRDTKPKAPEEPPKFRFSARMPNINAKDLEVLKLTALYTAKNGENWLKELRNREAGNFQFDFLRPTHSFFQYFRGIIDQYKILLEEDSSVEARIEELRHNVKDRFHILERAKQRAAYIKYVSQQKEKEQKKAEDDKREYASIDWHDFSVIATLTFDETDEAAELPVPMSLNDLQSSSLEQKASYSQAMRIEEAAPDEETYYNATNPGGSSGYPSAPTPMTPSAQPYYQPPPVATPEFRAPGQTGRDEEALHAERERARAQAAVKPGPSTIRIRNDYVPRAAAKKGGVQMVVCANCKQQIPANEYDEHVRIELLDPRWKEQKEKSDSRYATTMNTVDVANNLKRFASMRDDIYDGVTGMPISEEEAARRKRAAMSYDGQPDPAKDAVRIQEMQSMNVQEQLRRIQERHGK